MSVLTRLRGWIRTLLGATESDADSVEESNQSGETQLDPDNVTEVRTEATDESVTKLQDLKDRTEDAPADEE